MVTFPRAITFSSVSVTSGVVGTINATPSADHTQVTIDLSGVTNAQVVTITLNGVNDGNVTNNVIVGIAPLCGDVTGDTMVNSADRTLVGSMSGSFLSSSTFRCDVNVDGGINSADKTLTGGQSGTAVNVVAINQPIPASPDIDVQYAYDDAGRNTRLYVTNAAGSTANYDRTFTYDSLGRFEKIYNTNANELFRYAYDAASNETQRLNVQTNLAQVYVPDELNRMTRRDLKIGNNTAFAYEAYGYKPDRPGWLTSVDREDGKRDAFTYYRDNELSTAQYGLQNPNNWSNPQRAVNYIWDDAGNRNTVTDNGALANYSTTALNQYWQVGSDPVTNGNQHELANYQNVTYKYINDRHLSSISGADSLNGGVSNYQTLYDALGRCVVRILNGSTTYYIYDGEKAILEYRGWSAPSAANLYGRTIDEILMRTDYTVTPALTLYYQDDHEGSVTHLTSGTGAVLESYRYDAFGKPTIFDSSFVTRPSSQFNNRFMFTGREYVANFGVYEYRNRAYHPGLGRFMSEDPKLDADRNLFRYCGNDPVDRTDAMGLDNTLANPEFVQVTSNLALSLRENMVRIGSAAPNAFQAGAKHIEPAKVQGLPSGTAQKGINEKYASAPSGVNEGKNANLDAPYFLAIKGYNDMDKFIGHPDIQIYNGRYKEMHDADLFARENFKSRADSANGNSDFRRADHGVIHDTQAIALKRGFEGKSADISSQQSWTIGWKDKVWSVHPIFEHRDQIKHNDGPGGGYSYKHEIYPIGW